MKQTNNIGRSRPWGDDTEPQPMPSLPIPFPGPWSEE